MFFGKLNSITIKRRINNMHPIVFLPLFIAVIIAVSSCSAQKGSIIVLENPDGTGFTMDLKEWSSNNKCELSLSEGDVLQVEIVLEEGEISLTIRGENGAEPYAGNNLESMKFTVTVSETDNYITYVTGKNATGKITVKK